MSEVKRFIWVGVHGMIDHQKGGWVKHEDYAALKAECESNAKSAEYSAETNRKISRKNGEMHDEILSLKAERDKLAADRERFAVQCAAARIAVQYAQSQGFECTLNTPAVDAYANQLRAEGAASVGMLIRACAYEFPDSAKDIVEECAMIADNRAVNLRKENGNG